MRLFDLAQASEELGRTASRLGKVQRLADCLGRLRPEEVRIGVAYLSGEIPEGSIGVGAASLRDLPPPAASPPGLELLEVHRALDRLRATTGPGSQAARRDVLRALFAGATEPEQRFLVALLLGELRQGALEGVMVEAVARAARLPASEVRRALMVAGDLGAVAGAVLADGAAGLARFRLSVLRPVKPMLAQTATSLPEALARAREAAVEWKLDGARVQVHREGDEVRAFTRTLADVTPRLPEVVEAVRGLPLRAAILDGEAIALRPDGSPRPFQVTMSRLGSRRDVERHRRTVALSVFFFDLLHLDGEDLLVRPLRERSEALDERVPPELRVNRTETRDASTGERVLDEAVALGHEGVMVKSLSSPYEAGRRGAAWLKVKRAHTLDLVVLAAEWGHGRRRGWLSNLHLGARDTRSGGYVMLGKTFKGLTDETLAWQTERLLRLEVRRDAHTVHVRPELVVEVAFDGVQSSPRYPAGLALRFARVRGYRHDKGPEDADTVDAVRAIHDGGAGEVRLPGPG